MVTYNCFAGMIESIIPIYFENIHLGFFMMGQYRSNQKIYRSLLVEWEERFGSSEKLVIAYLKTPSFSQDQIESIQLGLNITIREVARKVGYDDPYYFSRLYKKYRGCSPANI